MKVTREDAQCERPTGKGSFFLETSAQCDAQYGPDDRAPFVSEAGHHALAIVDLESERLASLDPRGFVP